MVSWCLIVSAATGTHGSVPVPIGLGLTPRPPDRQAYSVPPGPAPSRRARISNMQKA
ncbi:protein of unknown function (plasmid) [Cupriavidus neocaledonicus]|uniref:Uncharacterized protein n=1 Tax=Cupriavidus neocaledonicus TaxID=1040979 RepID=A0A375HL84_9BURK|nr:hypothetical protein CBM2605_B10106 [Cupriavidus neocaledonicus]SPD58602.1 protein of unknown function [Cupriavidus neocaledonicus]